MGVRRDSRVLAYVEGHPGIRERSAQRVAAELKMPVDQLRVVVHESDRVRMRNMCLGWDVVEVENGAGA